jgi:uncharacterized membrane protein
MLYIARAMIPIHHIVRTRPRLVIAVTAGIAAGLLLPPSWSVVTRVLTAWNIVAWSYLCMMTWLMARAPHTTVRKIAEREDENAAAVVAIVSAAALLSIAAIVLELADIKALPPHERALHYVYTAVTLIGSWCLVGVIFTIHYAHMYYTAAENERPLRFPNEEHNPDYWDFLYFSFTIAVAVQTSDVSVLTRSMRKAVLAQSVLCFFFNAAVIGLSINIAAGVIGSS